MRIIISLVLSLSILVVDFYLVIWFSVETIKSGVFTPRVLVLDSCQHRLNGAYCGNQAYTTSPLIRRNVLQFPSDRPEKPTLLLNCPVLRAFSTTYSSEWIAFYGRSSNGVIALTKTGPIPVSGLYANAARLGCPLF